MKRYFSIVCVALSFTLIGCAIHDGHEDEPAPIWWPAFLYRPTTHPTDDEYNQTDASPTSPLTSPWQNGSQAGTAAVG